MYEREDEDYEKRLYCSVINYGNFVLAQFSSENNKRSLVFVRKVVEMYDHAFTLDYLTLKMN